MNLKDRLTSTENLLRSIRGGDASARDSESGGRAEAKVKGSVWTRPLNLRALFPGRTARAARPVSPKTTSASTPPPPRAGSIWTKPLLLKRRGKTMSAGVSLCAQTLCVAMVRNATGELVAARRFPLGPGQTPGEKGHAAFLRQCLDEIGATQADTDVWAVLRSPDLDLNVVTVPKLSGGKLDAAVFWTLQREKKFADAEYVLDYLVLGPAEDTDGGGNKLDALTCLARRDDLEALRAVFVEAGVPLCGVTAIPNAFLGVYKRRPALPEFTLAANIHVETDFSAIGLYTKDRLVFSRFIRSGGASMVEAMADHYQQLAKPRPAALDDLELPLPGDEPADGAAQQPAPQPLNTEEARSMLRHVLLGGPRPACADRVPEMTADECIDIIAPAIERLARQVERTLAYYASAKHARCDALHLSGELFGSGAIAQALAGQLGLPPVIFDVTTMTPGAAGLVPQNDRMILAPVLAAACSQPGRGINLLDTYAARTAREAKRAASSRVLLGLAGCMALLGCAGVFLDRANHGKLAQIAQIQRSMAALGPAMDENAIRARAEGFRQRQRALGEAANRLLAPAALAEIASCAPENVRILSFTAEYPQPAGGATQPGQPGQPGKPGQSPAAPKPAPGAKAPAKSNGVISIEGVVSGDRAEFDAGLARFILALQSSPMFFMPVVNESGLKDLSDGGQVLAFSMQLGVK